MKGATIELLLPPDCFNAIHRPGPADDVVADWLPKLRKQFGDLSLIDSARILYGYGAWDVDQLADLETNLERLLWIAGGDAGDAEAMGEPAEADGSRWVILEGYGYDRELAALKETAAPPVTPA